MTRAAHGHALAPLLTALALTGCTGTQSPLDPAGEQSERVFSVLQAMTWDMAAYLCTLKSPDR